MDSRAREVIRIGTGMFERKAVVDSLWQEIALNCYPERADFTSQRNEGEEFSDHLFSSYPTLARRELGNLLSSHLRPQGQPWFEIHVDDEELDQGDAERKFLEYMTKVVQRGMYDQRAGFVKATKQADHDFAAFGNAVIQHTVNAAKDGMLYRAHHLRDSAWSENAEGSIDNIHRKWKPTARQLVGWFKDKVSEEVKKAFEKDPEKEFECRHVVQPSRLYQYKSKGGKEFPFASLYVECESETVLEEAGLMDFPYTVPRWMTIAGSSYGRSMATEIALPDSRTMQVVIRTIREAAEKFVDPPMIAITDAIRGDIAMYAGGITIADMEYDERLGEVLRPLAQDRGGMPIGFEIATALREDLRNAFFLDKIQLPEMGSQMTAFEVRRRIQESIRSQSPLFEPIEKEYNSPLCEATMRTMMTHGAFRMDQMPESLKGKEIRFTFRSPLSDLAEQNESEIYKEVLQTILIPAAQVDPAQIANVNMTVSTRDAMRSAGWKAKWFNDPAEVDKTRQANQQKQAAMEQAAAMQQAGAVAEQGGKGMKAIMEAGGGG